MDHRQPMTSEEISVEVNRIRVDMQASTCCPHHAADVCMRVLMSFALDDTDDNPHQAAATLVRAAKEMAQQIRSGRFAVQRGLNS